MITYSGLAYGDRLGAQMHTLAELVYLAEANGQELVLYEELRDFRRGFAFLPVFEVDSTIRFIHRSGEIKKRLIRRYCRQFSAPPKSEGNWKRIYQDKWANLADKLVFHLILRSYPDFSRIKGLRSQVHCDPQLLTVKEGNYDIGSGYGTYQDWKAVENTVKNMFRFRSTVLQTAEPKMAALRAEAAARKPGASLISVHIRRGDYLMLSSLNLDESYYRRAVEHFDRDNCVFAVFSDDIEGCREMVDRLGLCAVYISGNTAAEDMYLMSRCDGNIIANSSFSFWGAFLNPCAEKTVVCPHDFIGQSSTENLYINGNYYPDDWIAI